MRRGPICPACHHAVARYCRHFRSRIAALILAASMSAESLTRRASRSAIVGADTAASTSVGPEMIGGCLSRDDGICCNIGFSKSYEKEAPAGEERGPLRR